MPRCLPILSPFFDRFFIDFYLQLRTPEPSKSLFFLRKNNVFSKKSLFEVGIDFCSMLVPTCLHFSSKNPPKSFQKSIPRCIVFSIDFCIDFSSILLRFWKPTWSHVGHFFVQNTATGNAPRVVFVGSMLFFDFLAVLAPSWPHFGSILEGSGVHFGGFWCPFFYMFVRFGEAFVRTVLASFSKPF